LEEEEEGASYLTDLSKVPDFVDEPPVEVKDVSRSEFGCAISGLMFLYSQAPSKEAVKTSA
jgi:hypothetical protein